MVLSSVLALVAACALPSFGAEEAFSSRGVTRQTVRGWVDVEGAWVNGATTLRVRFTANEDFKGSPPVQAGFFDDGKKLLYRFDRVPVLQTKGGGSKDFQALPNNLEKGKTYEIFFPVPPSIATGDNRWSDFLVRLGRGEQATYISYPQTDLDPDQFAWETAPSTDTTAQAKEVKLAIRQARRTPHRTNIWCDGGWKKGINVVEVSLMVEEGAESGGFYARAYYYDKDGKLLQSFDQPPRAEASNGREYVSLPAVWKNMIGETVSFPISPKWESGDKRLQDVVIVFGNGHRAVAAMSSNSSGKPEDFEFPEKALVLATAAAQP